MKSHNDKLFYEQLYLRKDPVKYNEFKDWCIERGYLKDLYKKSNECLEVATNCSQLKMPAPDGKLRLAIEQLLCIGYRELEIRKILGFHH